MTAIRGDAYGAPLGALDVHLVALPRLRVGVREGRPTERLIGWVAHTIKVRQY